MAQVGYRAVEIPTQRVQGPGGAPHYHLRPDWPEERIAAAQEHLHRLGLAVSCISPSTDFLRPHTGSLETEIAAVCQNVELAVRLGAPLVRPFATGRLPEGMDRGQAIAQMADALARCGDYAAARGVRIAVENHGEWPGLAQNFLDLLAAVRSEAVGITLHYPRETAAELLAAAPDKVWHLHLSDRRAAEAERQRQTAALRAQGLTLEQIAARLGLASVEELRPRPVPLGEGDADVRGVVRTLRRAGYAGWYNHEGPPEEDPEPTERRSIAHLIKFLTEPL